MAEARDRGSGGLPWGLLTGEAGERVAGTDLQQHRLALVLEQRPHAVREAHRPPNVLPPILGAESVALGYPSPRDIGDETQFWRSAGRLPYAFHEGGHNPPHHAREECVGGLHAP